MVVVAGCKVIQLDIIFSMYLSDLSNFCMTILSLFLRKSVTIIISYILIGILPLSPHFCTGLLPLSFYRNYHDIMNYIIILCGIIAIYYFMWDYCHYYFM